MLALPTSMENNFDIDYQGKPVPVQFEKGNKSGEYIFTVELPQGAVKLQCRKDNEGAYQWLDEGSNATAETRELGTSIEQYLMENSINL